MSEFRLRLAIMPGCGLVFVDKHGAIHASFSLRDLPWQRRVAACLNACEGITIEALEAATGTDAQRLLALEIAASVECDKALRKFRREGRAER